MAKGLLLIIAMLSIQQVYSQALNESKPSPSDPYKKKGFIGVNAGLSIPVGKFSNDESANSNNGFAQNGLHVNYIDLGYKITQSLAVRWVYFQNSNDLDYDKLRRSRSLSSDLNYISAEGSNYEVNGVFIGLSAIKAHKDFDLGINFLLGLSEIHIPNIMLSYRDSITNNLVEQNFEPVSNFSTGFSVGADLRIHLNEYLDFTSSVKYVIFVQSFEQAVRDQNSRNVIEFELSYEFITPTIGLAYRFGD